MENHDMKYKSTIEYYDAHAEEYSLSSQKADLSDLYLDFERYLPFGACILDVGCGSGRDSRYFSSRGYQVTAIDPSREMCRIANGIPGIEVRNISVQHLTDVEKYDGIWACASLLHISEQDIYGAIKRLVAALKKGGVLYASWKYGEGDRCDECGRFFTDYTEESIVRLFANVHGLDIVKCWTTRDTLCRNNQQWTNIIIQKNEE